MRFLVTGTAGFIGFHLARRLLGDGHVVVGFDGLTPYYDVRLKEERHAILARFPGFTPVAGMLEDRTALAAAFERAGPEIVIHLAAQAGVRHSLLEPRAFIDTNITGTWNLLEMCAASKPRHVMLASTSAVYGACGKEAFAETDRTDEPLSPYAATKKAMEVLAHAWSHLYRLPATIFRFFTVYGPGARPDMALYTFVEAISEGRPIDVYGEGNMVRDFVFIDDLVEAIVRLAAVIPAESNRVDPARAADTLSPEAPCRMVNIAGGRPLTVSDYIAAIERALGRKATRRLLPIQPGDVPRTAASPALLEALTGFRPSTPIDTGIAAFVAWYRDRARLPEPAAGAT
jgi:UDP-glucuronate 4-epimerase